MISCLRHDGPQSTGVPLSKSDFSKVKSDQPVSRRRRAYSFLLDDERRAKGRLFDTAQMQMCEPQQVVLCTL